MPKQVSRSEKRQNGLRASRKQKGGQRVNSTKIVVPGPNLSVLEALPTRPTNKLERHSRLALLTYLNQLEDACKVIWIQVANLRDKLARAV